MIGSVSGTGPKDYESRDPVPDLKILPFKYFVGQLSFYLKKNNNNEKKKKEKHGGLVFRAHDGLRC